MTTLTTTEFSATELAAIVAQFTALSLWQERYKALIMLAKKAPIYPETLKVDSHQIKSCENQVWIALIAQQGKIELVGFSDSKLMQGILHLMSLYVAQSAQKDRFEPHALIHFLKSLHLWSDFSPSKQKGIEELVNKMNQEYKIKKAL